MRRWRAVRAGALALALAAGTASQAAAQSAVTNRNQLSNTQTIDWNTVSFSNPLTVLLSFTGVTVSSNGSPFNCQAGGCWNGGFTNGQGLYFAAGGNSITFLFSQLVTGLATQAWFNYPYGGNVQVTTFRNNNQTFTYGLTTGGGYNSNSNQASTLGVYDPSGFDRLDVVTSGNTCGNVNEFSINPVDVGARVTPGPASMTLLGSGLVGIAGFIRRRRKAAQV